MGATEYRFRIDARTGEVITTAQHLTPEDITLFKTGARTVVLDEQRIYVKADDNDVAFFERERGAPVRELVYRLQSTQAIEEFKKSQRR